VKQLAAGDVEGAFRSFDAMGSLIEAPLEERAKLLAADYVSLISKAKTALVVAPTHAECEDVTKAIRQALKESKALGEGVEWQILRNLSWTKAQKSDPEHYRPGLVVQINRHVKGFARGEQLEVVAPSHGMVLARNKDGLHSEVKALPLSASKSFAVYERETIDVCVGDQIRITANRQSADGRQLSNGSLYQVDYIAPDGELVLENGARLGQDFPHLHYGYALTSHAAQGKTVDWVLLAQSPEMSSAASDLRQALVSISRGREGLKWYTTNIEQLQEDVSRLPERPMATEIMAEERVQPRRTWEWSASALMGRSGPEMSEDQTVVLRKAPELDRVLEITAPVPQREPVQEMVMEMGM
jgi:hypothetical protein